MQNHISNRYNFLERIKQTDWTKIQFDNDNNMSVVDIIIKYNITRGMINKARELGLFKRNERLFVMNDEQKRHLSQKRKEWIYNNPEKFKKGILKSRKSIPCEYFKQKLKDRNFIFLEEYRPLKDRYFHIDIAFPDKFIAIEINGNFHYNRDGLLKPYYQNRHDLLTNNGWKVIELPYSKIYDENILNEIINILNNSITTTEFNFETYIQENKKRIYEKQNKSCCDCGNKIQYTSTRCINCAKQFLKGRPRRKRKIVPPEIESGLTE